MQRVGLNLIVHGLIWIAAAYLLVLAEWSGKLAPWLMAVGTAGTLAGLACLGAARRRRRTPLLAAALAVAFLAVAGGLIVGLALPAPVAGDALLLGLPRATTLLLTLAGAIPLLLLPIAYALAFDDEVINEADLTRLRGEVAATRESGP